MEHNTSQKSGITESYRAPLQLCLIYIIEVIFRLENCQEAKNLEFRSWNDCSQWPGLIKLAPSLLDPDILKFRSLAIFLPRFLTKITVILKKFDPDAEFPLGSRNLAP